MDFSYLEKAGLYDYILPWLFAFTISYYVFGLVFRKNGKPMNRISGVLGFVVASFLMVYRPYNQTLSGFFSGLFGEYAVYSIVALFVLIALKATNLDYLLWSPFAPLKSLLTGKPIEETKKDKSMVALTVLAVVGIGLFIFFRNFKQPITLPGPDPNVLLLVAGFAAMIYLITLVTNKTASNKHQKDRGQQEGKPEGGEK